VVSTISLRQKDPFEPLNAAFADAQRQAAHVASDAPEWSGSRPNR